VNNLLVVSERGEEKGKSVRQERDVLCPDSNGLVITMVRSQTCCV